MEQVSTKVTLAVVAVERVGVNAAVHLTVLTWAMARSGMFLGNPAVKNNCTFSSFFKKKVFSLKAGELASH